MVHVREEYRRLFALGAFVISLAHFPPRQIFFEINDSLHAKLTLTQLQPIVHNYIYFLGQDDVSLRQ